MVDLAARCCDRAAENGFSRLTGAGLQIDVNPEVERLAIHHTGRFAKGPVVQAPDGGREDVTGGEAGKRMPVDFSSVHAKGVKSADFAGILRAECGRPVGERSGGESAVQRNDKLLIRREINTIIFPRLNRSGIEQICHVELDVLIRREPAAPDADPGSGQHAQGLRSVPDEKRAGRKPVEGGHRRNFLVFSNRHIFRNHDPNRAALQSFYDV